jgi:hypothetical protein
MQTWVSYFAKICVFDFGILTFVDRKNKLSLQLSKTTVPLVYTCDNRTLFFVSEFNLFPVKRFSHQLDFFSFRLVFQKEIYNVVFYSSLGDVRGSPATLLPDPRTRRTPLVQIRLWHRHWVSSYQGIKRPRWKLVVFIKFPRLPEAKVLVFLCTFI